MFLYCPSRAGHKLEAAIEQLGIDVSGKIALDSGLSTGGFTDCLLQYGASFVYGVDVGYGQVIQLFGSQSGFVPLIKSVRLSVEVHFFTTFPEYGNTDQMALQWPVPYFSLILFYSAVLSLVFLDYLCMLASLGGRKNSNG